MIHRSNPCRKDNPRSAIGNAAVTPRVPATEAFLFPPASGTERAWELSAVGVAWLVGLPRRAGAWLHAMNDAEAQWQHWQVTEGRCGLSRQYRDERFGRGQLQVSLTGPDPAPPAAGDR